MKGVINMIEKTDLGWTSYIKHTDILGIESRVLVAWHPDSLLALLGALQVMGVQLCAK